MKITRITADKKSSTSLPMGSFLSLTIHVACTTGIIYYNTTPIRFRKRCSLSVLPEYRHRCSMLPGSGTAVFVRRGFPGSLRLYFSSFDDRLWSGFLSEASRHSSLSSEQQHHRPANLSSMYLSLPSLPPALQKARQDSGGQGRRCPTNPCS